MNQTVKRKRYGPTRIRCMNETLRQRLNKLIFHGFSPIMVKKIMLCLYGCRISILTVKRHRKYLYSAVGESFKDFKQRGEELKHGRGGWVPPEWLNLYQPPSDFPTETSRRKPLQTGIVTKQAEKELPPASIPEPETGYSKKEVKVLVGKPL